LDSLTFISNITTAAIWPITILIVVVMLKNPIEKLILNLSKMRYKDFEIDFYQKIEELGDKAAAAQLPEVGEPSSVCISKLKYDKRNLAPELSTTDSILSAWILVEKEVRSSAKKHDMSDAFQAPFNRVVKFLLDRQFISQEMVDLINFMRSIRSDVVHMPDISVSNYILAEYNNTAVSIVDFLRDERKKG